VDARSAFRDVASAYPSFVAGRPRAGRRHQFPTIRMP